MVACIPFRASATLLVSPGPDSLAWRFEIGGATDGTDEIYYGAFVDTTFLPRRRVSHPRVNTASVALASFQGTRRQRAASYSFQGEASYGDLVKRGDWLASWREELTSQWGFLLDQRFQYRDDRSFDLKRREWEGGFNARLRRLGYEGGRVEMMNSFSVQRALEDTTGFFLSNTFDRLSLSYEDARILEREWGVSAGAAYRDFPDSTSRTHFEYSAQGRLRQYFGSLSSFEFTGWVMRRQPREDVATSRDRFWFSNATGEMTVQVAELWKATARAELEDTRYDEENAAYFDYSVARARVGGRYEPGWRWFAEAGPRIEWLRAPREPLEEYLESAGWLDFSWLDGASYLSFTPAAGWREYRGSSETGLAALQHSRYAFYELTGYFDQRLPWGLRARASGLMRWERHTNADDDGCSLYFSFDLRRIF